MKYYGYTRTSTKEQHLDRGILEIQEFGKQRDIVITKIYADQISGKTFERKNYNNLKRRMKQGDCLIITEIDRLGRNRNGILNEMNYFRQKNIRLMVLEIPTTVMDFRNILDDKMASMMAEMVNNIFLELYASVAEMEFEKNKKRQREGIEAMKKRGEWDRYGRPRATDPKKFEKAYRKVISREMTRYQVMEQLGISEATYYRYREEIRMKNGSKN